MNTPFSEQLQQLRYQARLTNGQLAERADVPESLISGLQNNNRRVGEFQALKIGRALGLSGETLERFVFDAVDTCTEKVLNRAKAYPSRLLNLLALQLDEAGVAAEAICGCDVGGDDYERNVTLSFASGKTATLKTQLIWS